MNKDRLIGMLLNEFTVGWGDIDGGWLQDALVECGMLEPRIVTREMLEANDFECEADEGDTLYFPCDEAQVLMNSAKSHEKEST